MNRLLACTLFAIATGSPAPPAAACSEGMFNSGKGLPFQTYLAPRPAQVLVNLQHLEGDAERLQNGLRKAGHEVTVVEDLDAMQAALRAQRFDVLITALDGASAVAESSTTPRIVPVVERAERRSAAVRERFSVTLTRGASLGQVLSSINRVLGD
jgi:hypothetical protein